MANLFMSFMLVSVSLTSKLAIADAPLYNCAKNLANLNTSSRSLGPVFFEENIAFTSTSEEPGVGQKMFIVITPNQVLATPMSDLAIQRYLFRVGSDRYFIGYMHGEILGNRVFEFSRGSVPAGKRFDDYKAVEMNTGNQFIPAISGLLDQQLDEILKLITDGNIEKSKTATVSIAACQKLEPSLHGKSLSHNVDVYNVWAQQPTVAIRLPASRP
jgi:hypothetical protein